jgi:hypothetical protein
LYAYAWLLAEASWLRDVYEYFSEPLTAPVVVAEVCWPSGSRP